MKVLGRCLTCDLLLKSKSFAHKRVLSSGVLRSLKALNRWVFLWYLKTKGQILSCKLLLLHYNLWSTTNWLWWGMLTVISPNPHVYRLRDRNNFLLRGIPKKKDKKLFLLHSTSSRMWMSSGQMPRTKHSALNAVSQMACEGKEKTKTFLTFKWISYFILHPKWCLWLLLYICWTQIRAFQ